MLRQVIDRCPHELWDAAGPDTPAVWQHVYHALLGLRIWLHWPVPAIRLPDFHRDDADMQPGSKPAFSREKMAAFAAEVFGEVDAFLARLTPENALEVLTIRGREFARADLVLSQIRHVQHHVGWASAELRSRGGVTLEWAGYGES
jgi:hypothetical protein